MNTTNHKPNRRILLIDDNRAIHGGFIRVASEVGKGATFRVYLPAETGPHISETKPRDSRLLRGNGECVLVIDDEEAIRAVTQHALEEFG